MVLKLYYDLMSQPSRALYILLKVTKIPFEPCPVALREGQHFTEQYKEQISRFQKVPVIHHDDFKLSESIAIIRYLSRHWSLPDNWYPKNSKLQAKVDEYLEWQHNNIRLLGSMYFRTKWMEPKIMGKPANENKVAHLKDNLDMCLDSFAELWLQNKKYIAGNEISVADLWAVCELEQPRMAGYDCCEGRPILKEWMDRVKNELSPIYEEAHFILEKIVLQSKSKL